MDYSSMSSALIEMERKLTDQCRSAMKDQIRHGEGVKAATLENLPKKTDNHFVHLHYEQLLQLNEDLTKLKSLLGQLKGIFGASVREMTEICRVSVPSDILQMMREEIRGGENCLSDLGLTTDVELVSPDRAIDILVDLEIAVYEIARRKPKTLARLPVPQKSEPIRSESPLQRSPPQDLPIERESASRSESNRSSTQETPVSPRTFISLKDTLSEIEISPKSESPRDVSSSSDKDECNMCYVAAAIKVCKECDKVMCADCDFSWHKRKDRQKHERTNIPKSVSTPNLAALVKAQPPPPKISQPPVPAPRVKSVSVSRGESVSSTGDSSTPSPAVAVSRVEPPSAAVSVSRVEPPSPAPTEASNWFCVECTFENPGSRTHCEMCGGRITTEEELTPEDIRLNEEDKAREEEERKLQEQIRREQLTEEEKRKNSEFMLNILNILKNCELSGVSQPMVELTVKYWLSKRRGNEPFCPEKYFESLQENIDSICHDASLLIKKKDFITDVHRSEVEWILRHEGFNLSDRNVAVKCCERRMIEVQRLSDSLIWVSHEDIHNAIGKVGYRTVDVNRYLNRTVLPKGCLKKLTALSQAQARETFQEKFVKDNVDKETRMRCCMVEQDLTWGKAEILMKLLDDAEVKDAKHNVETITSAAHDCIDFERAKKFLLSECQICYGVFSKSQMESFPLCGCELCQECFRDWLTQCVTETQPSFWQCPVCSSPEAEDRDNLQQHICFLQMIMENRTEMSDLMDRFHQKVTNWSMMQNPDFRWCGHKCQNGFIYNREDKKMQCPVCREYTCKDCRKQWEEEHKGRTCEEFEAYKLANDPEMAKILEDIGIQCPKCKVRYEVARGGCMHFKCRQCSAEFCSGCSNYQFLSEKCPRGEICKAMGLHAHHPRNCLFYLRDYDVPSLKKLLDEKEVEYVKDPEGHPTCQVTESSQTPQGLVDHLCGVDVFEGTDLCEKHYKEYLVTKINRSRVDPMPLIIEINQVTLIITREQKNPPPKAAGETDDVYRQRLVAYIEENIPLPELK